MASSNQELQFDRSVLGVEVEVGKFEVTVERILAFCQAMGETSPLYTDEEAAKAGPYRGLVAPPAFYSATGINAGPNQSLDPKVKFGNTMFAAGQRSEYFAPARPGDTITATHAVVDVYEKTGRTGRMVFVVRRTTYTNQDGVKLATMESSMVHRNIER